MGVVDSILSSEIILFVVVLLIIVRTILLRGYLQKFRSIASLVILHEKNLVSDFIDNFYNITVSII